MFRKYMKKQWLLGNFCIWEIYLTRICINEQSIAFNTQKRKLKLAVPLQHIMDCCSHHSMAPIAFEQRKMVDRKLIDREYTFCRSSISFLVDDTAVVRVSELPPLRLFAPSRGQSADVAAQFSANYGSVKIEGQPSSEWAVYSAKSTARVAITLKCVTASTSSTPFTHAVMWMEMESDSW
ncbi:hypothetical protein GN244_ATG13860 [Phytophthora infestans]|uniref:Uncharacterized protein n=1 Tax=Phytophthora infestans TaxID=4787 RepID=A0A833SGM1_PHYIN|nr:hypothetical protein GN244_ATG13860 [Phytophthora infestans]